MSRIITDAKLSLDVYGVNNTDVGGSDGWKRIKVSGFNPAHLVEDGSNFKAQLYSGSDGTYKIAFRGSSDWGAGDRATNAAAALGRWTAELSQGIKFVQFAIEQIAATERITFSQAASKLSLTGHSQGGWEQQVLGKLFGLSGTSFDGPGGAGVLQSIEYREAVARLQVIHKDYKGFDGPVQDSLARKYSLVGTVGVDTPGTAVSLANLMLIPSLIRPVKGTVASHRLVSIIQFETLRARSPVLQQYSINDFSNAYFAASSIAIHARLFPVPVHASYRPHENQAVTDFLASQVGAKIDIWRGEGQSILIMSTTGDSMMLGPDGSGTRVISDESSKTFQTYQTGGVPGPVMTISENIVFYQRNQYSAPEIVGVFDPIGEVRSNLETDFFVSPTGSIVSSSGELQGIFNGDPEAASSLRHLLRLLVNFDLADQNRHDPFANTKIPDWVKNAFRIHTPNNPYGPSIQA